MATNGGVAEGDGPNVGNEDGALLQHHESPVAGGATDQSKGGLPNILIVHFCFV